MQQSCMKWKAFLFRATLLHGLSCPYIWSCMQLYLTNKVAPCIMALTLSVTNSASAPDWRFPATLLHACVILSKSTHPFHPAHARCGDLSFCRFTDLRTASVPAFQPAQTFMTCLTQSGPCCFFYIIYFWKGRWKQHQSYNRHIQAPTDHFWGCVGGFYEIMPPSLPLTGSEFTNVRRFWKCVILWPNGLTYDSGLHSEWVQAIRKHTIVEIVITSVLVKLQNRWSCTASLCRHHTHCLGDLALMAPIPRHV